MSGHNVATEASDNQWLEAVRGTTPARVFVERSGLSYRTKTWLQLRQDHAAAADAVHAELDLHRDFEPNVLARHSLFEVHSQAENKTNYLRRPDLGRSLTEPSRHLIADRCPIECDLQVVIGDGLSVSAVIANAPPLLASLEKLSSQIQWRFGQPFVVRYCRVGIMNEIGELLRPVVLVLLIGERPGLATANSLSAYIAYRPKPGNTDAQRNLISNIHDRGVSIQQAATRIMNLAQQMRQATTSGISIKESLEGAYLPGSFDCDSIRRQTD